MEESSDLEETSAAAVDQGSANHNHTKTNDETTADNELLLDTKGACFFCLSENLSAEEPKLAGMTTVCLRNICRYFDINPNFILKECLMEEEDEEQVAVPFLHDKYNFSVQLCSTCTSITNKLSELIRQMELTKMMVKYKVHEMYQVLTEGTSDFECRWKRVHEKIRDNPVELRLVERLRKETEDKCYTKLQHTNKHCLPKVLLHRLTTPSCTEETCSSSPENVNTKNIFITESTTDNNNDNPTTIPASVNEAASTKKVVVERQAVIEDEVKDVECEKLPTGDDLGNMESATSSNDGAENIVQKPTDSRMFVLKTMKNYYIKVHSVGKRHKCLLCNQVQNREYTTQRHIVAKHPEIIFAQCKLQNTPQLRFNDMFARVLTTTLAQVKSTLPKQDKRQRLSCPFCKKKFFHGFNLQYHVCLEHYQNLKEELVRLQDSFGKGKKQETYNKIKSSLKKTKVTQSVLSHQQDTNNNPTGRVKKHFKNKMEFKRQWTCGVANGGCGKAFSSYFALSRHKKGHCSKRKRRKIWTCSSASGGCGRRFSSHRSFQRHKILLKCDGIRTTNSFCGMQSEITGASSAGTTKLQISPHHGHIDGSETVENSMMVDPIEIEVKIEVETGNLDSSAVIDPTPITYLINSPSKTLTTNDDGTLSNVNFTSPTHQSSNFNNKKSRSCNNSSNNLVKETFARYYEPDHHKCLTCNKLFKTETSFQRHLVRNHADLFFCQLRQNNVSEERFRECCNEMLSLIVDQAERLEIRPGCKRKKILCPHCDQMCADVHMTKCHLILKHYNLLEEEVMKDTFTKREMPLVITGTYSCDNNGQQTVHQELITTAIKTVNSDHYSNKKKEKIKRFQRNALASGEGNLTGTYSIAEHATQPSLLPTTASDPLALKNHVEGGGDTVEEKKISENPSDSAMRDTSLSPLPSLSPNQNESSDSIQNFVKNVCAIHFETTQKPDSFKCRICQQHHSYSKIRHHIVFCHPEKFFSHLKSKPLPDFLFKIFCDRVMREATKEAQKFLRDTGKLFCLDCHLRFSDFYDLRYHLLLKHYSLLEEKVAKMQQDQIEIRIEAENYKMKAAIQSVRQPLSEMHRSSKFIASSTSNNPLGTNTVMDLDKAE